jgi:hypothetical protein
LKYTLFFFFGRLKNVEILIYGIADHILPVFWANSAQMALLDQLFFFFGRNLKIKNSLENLSLQAFIYILSSRPFIIP